MDHTYLGLAEGSRGEVGVGVISGDGDGGARGDGARSLSGISRRARALPRRDQDRSKTTIIFTEIGSHTIIILKQGPSNLLVPC